MDDLGAIRAIVGGEHVRVDAADREFFATDVYNHLHTPMAVVSPGSVEQLSQTIAAATSRGIAIVPRGGGASYTDGYLPSTPQSLLLDTGRLNKIVEINETDMYVTVEPGVTWFDLNRALQEQGLRTPFWGPFSGLKATVGGSISQNSVSMGTGAFGVSADSVLGMDIVIANGDLITTGSGATDTSSPFFRHYGPDLTGVFTGDAGALGVKAGITLRLIRRPSHREALSFGFTDFLSLSEGMAEVARSGAAADNWGLDPALQRGQMGRVKAADAFAAAANVFRSSRHPFEGAARVAKIALAGKRFFRGHPYSAHYLVEGNSRREVRSRAASVRDCVGAAGEEIANTVPAVMGAQPFMEMYPVLGPAGERWVPQHGILAFSKTADFYRDIEDVYARNAEEMARWKVTSGAMFMTVSTHAFLYEPVLYWEDDRTVFHRRFMPSEYLATLPEYPANPEGRRLVRQIREQIQDVFYTHGAVHLQVGKCYPYLRGRDATATALIRNIKRAVDPDGLLNPGALQLDEPQTTDTPLAAVRAAE